MTDIDARIEYLTAALDHTEEVANSAPPGKWTRDTIVPEWSDSTWPVERVLDGASQEAVFDGEPEALDHISLHDPASVLAGVKADRKLIRVYEGASSSRLARLVTGSRGISVAVLSMCDRYAHLRDVVPGWRKEWEQ